METTWLTEYDLVRVGDDVCLNADCTLQTHLFEDRVMKMDRVDIGHGCSVGMDAVVLYGSRMEAGSSLGDLSLLMKGEALPAHTAWIGSPARPAQPLASMVTEGASDTPPSAPRTTAPTAHLRHDAKGRLGGEDVEGCAQVISRAHAGPHTVQVAVDRGRVGVDLEPCEPSAALAQAAELFLPSERAWADQVPEDARWRRWLALWTAKEAVLKALGEGFAFGLDQVELAPDGAGGLRLARLGGSAKRAEGWRLTFDERDLGGRLHLVATAQV
jgi:phosphopantetheinyl transferase (holo-ACP synthase)